MLTETVPETNDIETVAPARVGDTTFPQSKDCGPIEAPQTKVPISLILRFPQSKDCGPIEACRRRMQQPSATPFPQSKDCGPIEAARC